MALFGGTNVDRNPGTATSRSAQRAGQQTFRDASNAARRTAPINVPGFNTFQKRAFNLIGQQGRDPSIAAAQAFLPGLARGKFVGKGPGQQTLQQAAGGRFANAALPGLQQFAGGDFIGQGPGQGTLQQFSGGGLQNAALPAAQSALDFSRGISGIPGGLKETAAGGNLASPFLSGEFNRITDPIAEQLRNVTLPSVAGTFAGSGRLGSRSFQAAENRALESGERAISGVAADLLGRERGFQQQAQLAIPGIQQQQLQGQLGASGQLGQFSASDLSRQASAAGTLQNNFNQQLGTQLNALGQVGQFSGADIQNRLGAASTLQNSFNQQVGQAGQASLAAPQFAQQALAARVNPLLQAGGQQQALAQQQARRRDDAIQREVNRAAQLGAGGGPAGGFPGAPPQSSAAQSIGGLLGSFGGAAGGFFLGGPGGAAVGGQLGAVGGRQLGSFF